MTEGGRRTPVYGASDRPRRAARTDPEATDRQPADRPHTTANGTALRTTNGTAPRNPPEPWNVPDGSPEDPAYQARPLATLVSFHYLRSAVRRRWRVCAVFAIFGVLLAGAYLKAKPTTHMATTTLMLTHPGQMDPSGAIATDISLVKTRTVAERTIKALGLDVPPEDIMNSVAALPTSSTQVLQITMSAATDSDAVRTLDVFTKQYLDFRAQQISEQSDMLINGYQKQIDDLQSQAQTLRSEVERLSSGGHSADQVTEAVTKLSQMNDKISALQGTVDDLTVQQKATVSASGVIDPAAVTTKGALRRIVLVLVSGLIGGLAVGFGAVVLRAIVSDRLWLRMEVAAALNTSVLLSARTITPLPRRWQFIRWLPWVSARRLRHSAERDRVAQLIAKTANDERHGQSLAVLCLEDSDEIRFGLAAAAFALEQRGTPTTIVDLSDAGSVEQALTIISPGTLDRRPTVFRPSIVPSRQADPTRIDVAAWADVARTGAKGSVTLVLADLDPAIGVDHLTAWTDSVIVAVSAGRSSVELVRTAGDLVRSSGLHLRGALLLGTVADDLSSGIVTKPAEPQRDVPPATVSRPGPSVGRSL